MPTQIDSRFIDVDLKAEAERLKFLPGDTTASLSLRDASRVCSAPNWEESQPMYEEALWPKMASDIGDAGLDGLIVEVKNQKNEGSCVGNQWAQQLQVCQAVQFGKHKVILISATSAYKQIGSSPNSGAMVEDSFRKGRDVGALPLDTPENRARFKHVMPAVGFRTPWPPGWEATAKMFRIIEAFICTSVKAIVSALFSGFSVGVGRAGHSITYLRPMYQGKNLVIKYVNSWGEWGDAGGDFDYGFGYDSVNLIRQSAYWAFAVRSVTVPNFQLAA